MLKAMLNKMLRMDEDTIVALGQLSGKVFMIDILNTDLVFFLTPATDGIHVTRDTDATPDVQIRARPGSFMAMLFPQLGQDTVPHDVEIIGNVSLIRQLQVILREFDPDWEEPLSKLFGDNVTHKLARTKDRLKRYIASSGNNLMLDISEYLRFEKKMVPDQEELARFYQLVDLLRGATDRLEKQVEKLERY